MAEPKEILYRNWIKAGLGLLYVKEGIQDFIVDEINNFRSNVLGKLPGASRCSIHTIQNVLRCPTRGICSGRPCRFHDNTDPGKIYTPCLICEAIRKEIEIAHRYGQPSYKNTRSELWCTGSWELAKCFMPAQGYSDKNTADDTDLSGLISVILNNTAFQNEITEILGQPGNKFDKVRNVRNSIMYNAKMETPTTDLNSYFNILNDVLNDSKHLQGLTKVKDAKYKLYQLQSNIITITTEDEQMIRYESLKALERKKEECIYEIDKKKYESIQEIIQEIDKMTEGSIQVIGKSKEEGIKELNRNVSEGIVRTKTMLEGEIQAGVNKKTEAEAVKWQQNEREHMHTPADKVYKRKTNGPSIKRKKMLGSNLEKMQGPSIKRKKKVGPNLEKMQGYFKKTMQTIPDAFTAPTEADEMFKKLSESKRLYVVGPQSSLYIQTTLYVIKGVGIDINRCVEMTEGSDWKDINSNDVDLVLFRDPFGFRQITSKRTSKTLVCLDSINTKIGRVPLKERMFVIITSDYDVHLQYMDKCCQEPHAILTDVVLFQAPTSKKDPHVVIDERPSMTLELPVIKQEPGLGKDDYGVLKTLQEHTKEYIDYYASHGVYAQQFEEAKKILRQHKMLAISGPRYSGKTSLATKLMALYSSDRCFLLQRPSDMRYIQLGDLSIVLVEDFTGTFEPNRQTAINWYGVFDVLLSAVLSGQLSVIIVSEEESFRRCKLPTHGLLRYDITLASPELPVIMPEPGLDLATGGAGCGGSSGDDSSSESDSKYFPKHENQKRSDRKIHLIKNIKQWDDAITETYEEAIRKLLKAGKLPNSRQIRNVIQVFGRKSGAMTRIYRDVSRRILNRDDQIVRVEPAYEFPDEDDVTFIIYLKQPQTDLNFADLEFKVVERVIGQYSSEGKEIVDIEVKENLQFTFEEADRLRKCLEKHSKTLMEKHSNLQMISASHFKSKNYGNEDLKETMCVVLYVRVKGFIPLTEECLPNKLNGIPTDIREGGFEFLAHAGERHTHLKMGCEITGSKGSGTIGPFLKQDGNTYCLTAAHVLVGPPCVDNTTLPSMTTAGHDPIHVYQPNPARSKSALKHVPFGSVYCYKYSNGGGHVPGIDAAAILIQDERRLPNSGEFPESAIIQEDDLHMEVDVDENVLQNLKYISGKVCDRNFFKDNHGVEILKFGAVTGATRGLLHIVGTSVRYDKLHAEHVNKWELNSQIEISSSFEGQIFADHGDSGALVLASYGGRRNDLRALGLLIGRSSTGRILATPMHAILKEFGLTNSHVMAFQERYVDPSISVDSEFVQTASSTHADIQKQSEETFSKAKFESIEKAMTDNKNETSAIRSQVDATKSETSAIRSQVDALSTNFVSFNTNFERLADTMFQMMSNHKSNASDKNQNSGT